MKSQALCSRLGVSDFAVREEATRQLIAEGKPVIDEVAATAAAENLEVAMRCLRILRELYERPDEPTKLAARSASRGSPHRGTARLRTGRKCPQSAGSRPAARQAGKTVSRERPGADGGRQCGPRAGGWRRIAASDDESKWKRDDRRRRRGAAR